MLWAQVKVGQDRGDQRVLSTEPHAWENAPQAFSKWESCRPE